MHRTGKIGSRLAGMMLSALIGLGGLNMPAARADDGPTLIVTSIQLNTWRDETYWSSTAQKMLYDTSSWIPRMTFRVRGPVTGGSQFSVDFTRPNGSPWLQLDCPTTETATNSVVTLETPRDESDAGQKLFTNEIGVFGFKIKLKNELAGTNSVLFTGRFKVDKVGKSLGIPAMKNKYDYIVDHDWALPIGYVWFETKESLGMPMLRVSLWLKGQVDAEDVAGYVFYNGTQIGSTKDSAGDLDEEEVVQTASDDAGDPEWKLDAFGWNKIRMSHRLSGKSEPGDDQPENQPYFYLDKHPGNYEVKVLRAGHLVRDLQFAVGDDGKVVDTGIAAANNLATARIVVPVKVIGTMDNPWNAEEYKTDAFFGNPLKGFVAP